jgi:hypothetical protein
LNCTATSTVKDLTLVNALEHQLYSDKAKHTSVAYIQALGCKVYVYIQKERCTQSKKLSDCAKIDILVGFEDNHIYQVYVSSWPRDKIVYTLTVTFDENPKSITGPVVALDLSEDKLYISSDKIPEKDIDLSIAGGTNDVVLNIPDTEPEIFENIKPLEPLENQEDPPNEVPEVSEVSGELEASIHCCQTKPPPLSLCELSERSTWCPAWHFDEEDFPKGCKTVHLFTGLNFVIISEDLPDVQSFIAAVHANPDTLMTYKAAIHSHDSIYWKKAIDKEFDSLIKNKT